MPPKSQLDPAEYDKLLDEMVQLDLENPDAPDQADDFDADVPEPLVQKD